MAVKCIRVHTSACSALHSLRLCPLRSLQTVPRQPVLLVLYEVFVDYLCILALLSHAWRTHFEMNAKWMLFFPSPVLGCAVVNRR